YVEHGNNWDWITGPNRQRWFEVLNEHLSPERRFSSPPSSGRPPPDREHGPPPGSGPGVPAGTLTISPFILLLDAGQKIIEGPPNATIPPELKPIDVEGTRVGYLGYTRRTEISRSIDRLFA